MAKILVVDDAAFMRRVIADVIVEHGHEVIAEARDGEEAIDVFKRVRPDVTTLDITMPKLDGLTVLREILAYDPGAKVVVCSALGQEAKVLEAIRSGAKDFVVKPFQADRLVGAIERLT